MRKAVEILKKTKDGREALFEILELTKAWGHIPSGLSHEDTYRAIGKRSVGVEIIQNLLTDDMDAFKFMVSEHSLRSQMKDKGEQNDD